MPSPEENPHELTGLTAEIVAAYVGKNSVRTSELPDVIAAVHGALKSLGQPQVTGPEKPKPMLPIKKTVTPDYLISLEDGKHYKSLKRHLSGRGLTPAEYRAKWGLPHDYPMTAPAYAAKRSELARAIGLGRKRSAAPVAKPPRARKKAAQTEE